MAHSMAAPAPWAVLLVCLSLLHPVAAARSPPPGPFCQVLLPNREPCRRFTISNYCCFGRHLYETLLNVTTDYVEDGAFPSANVSFNTNTNANETGFYLLGRAGRSPLHSECYFVETGPGKERVSVANLSASTSYMIQFGRSLQNTHEWLKRACVRDTENFFHSSVLDLQFNGSNARLQLYPPNKNEMPPALSSVQVTLYSSATNFTCRKDGNCTVVGGVETSSLCFEQPYSNSLEIKNASRFFNGSHGLRYHCAVVQLVDCCLKVPFTILEAVAIPTPEQPGSDTRLASYYMGFGVLLVLGLILVLSARSLHALYCRNKMVFLRDEPSEEAELQELQGLLRPVVLLYCWEMNEHLTRVVKTLETVIREAGVEVTDPYKNHDVLLQNVYRAAEMVFESDSNFIIIATRRSQDVYNQVRKNIPLDNAYDRFYAYVLEMMTTTPVKIQGKLILTLRLQRGLDIPSFVTRAYDSTIAEHLVRDIPGVSQTNNWKRLFDQLHDHVRRYKEIGDNAALVHVPDQ